MERKSTGGGIRRAAGVVSECTLADSRVRAPVAVAPKTENTDGCVVSANGVRPERGNTDGRVIAAFGVAEKRVSADSRVEDAVSIVKERLVTKCALAKSTVRVGKCSKSNCRAETKLLGARWADSF